MRHLLVPTQSISDRLGHPFSLLQDGLFELLATLFHSLFDVRPILKLSGILEHRRGFKGRRARSGFLVDFGQGSGGHWWSRADLSLASSGEGDTERASQ